MSAFWLLYERYMFWIIRIMIEEQISLQHLQHSHPPLCLRPVYLCRASPVSLGTDHLGSRSFERTVGSFLVCFGFRKKTFLKEITAVWVLWGDIDCYLFSCRVFKQSHLSVFAICCPTMMAEVTTDPHIRRVYPANEFYHISHHSPHWSCSRLWCYFKTVCHSSEWRHVGRANWAMPVLKRQRLPLSPERISSPRK